MRASFFPLLLLSTCFSSMASAALVLDSFTTYATGENLATPLQGGTGWAGAWSAASNNGTLTATAVVGNASPLGAGGQYLDVSLANSGAGNINALYREMDASSLAVRQGRYTVSFQWRPDSFTSFSASNDRFEFIQGHNNTTGLWSANNNDSTGADLTQWSPYLLGVFGVDRGANNSAAKVFTAYHPVTAAVGQTFAGDRYFDVGMDPDGAGPGTGSGGTLLAVAGTAYAIGITVDPQAKKYDVTVSDGNTTVFSTGLNFWGNPSQGGAFLSFVSRGDGANEVREFSIDQVSLEAAVPEPAGVALLSGLVALGWLGLRRRLS